MSATISVCHRHPSRTDGMCGWCREVSELRAELAAEKEKREAAERELEKTQINLWARQQRDGELASELNAALTKLTTARREVAETIAQHDQGHSPCNCAALRSALAGDKPQEDGHDLNTCTKPYAECPKCFRSREQ